MRLLNKVRGWFSPTHVSPDFGDVITRDQVKSVLVGNSLLDRARYVCQDVAARADENSSGEWKRHHAYARLIKEFPDERRAKIGLVIELVLDKD